MNLINNLSIQPYGEALVTFGLEVRDGISGIGLVTRGFIYDTYAIWLDTTVAAPITTNWATGVSVAATTWTDESFGIFGDSVQR